MAWFEALPSRYLYILNDRTGTWPNTVGARQRAADEAEDFTIPWRLPFQATLTGAGCPVAKRTLA